MENSQKTKNEYNSNICRKMYLFFTTYEDRGAPSVAKFARSLGLTVEELLSYRKEDEFERAYRECSEIRRDYLIDQALERRFDPSFVKFLLSEEEDSGDGEFTLHLEVCQ